MIARVSHRSNDLTLVNEHHNVYAVVRPNTVRARRGPSNPCNSLDLIIGTVRAEDARLLPRKRSVIGEREASSRARSYCISD